MKKINILIINDNADETKRIKSYLSLIDEFVLEVTRVTNFTHSKQVLANGLVDVILFTLIYPYMDSLEVLREIAISYPNLPIVLITEICSQEISLSAIKFGAQDCIIKDHINQHSLFKSIVFAIERKNMEIEMKYLANHDPLTGLPNRRLFSDRLTRGMKRLFRKTDQLNLGILLLDLNDFKNVNDRYGHQIGDQVLMMISDRLKIRLRQNDTVARIGGDEFVVILEGIDDEDIGMFVAKKLLEIISQPIEIENHQIVVTASIGISYYPIHGKEVDDLLKKADLAMYKAKTSTEGVCIYNEI